jgi:hypothetical protein
MARPMHSAFKDPRLVVIEKARHLTPLAVPDMIAAELRKLWKAKTRNENFR